MTKPPVMRGGEPFSPPPWEAQPSNAQPNTTRCIKPSRTVDSKVAVDMHIEVSREATKLNSKCVPPTTTSISKAKPCDADLHTCASTPMRCGQPTTILRLDFRSTLRAKIFPMTPMSLASASTHKASTHNVGHTVRVGRRTHGSLETSDDGLW